jgi:MFS family permease
VIVEFVQAPSSMGYGFGSSVVVSGMVLVPLSLGSFLASRCLDWYARHFGRRTMIPLGAGALAVSSLFFAFEHRALWESFVASGLAGVGIGFTFAAMPGFIVRAVSRSETGSATGFYQVVRSVGLSIGSALAAATLTAYTHRGETFPKVQGFQVTLLMAAGLGAATAVISFVLVGRNANNAHSTVTQEVEETMEEEAEAGALGLMLANEPLAPKSSEPGHLARKQDDLASGR